VETVVLVADIVFGETPATGTVWVSVAVPLQSLLSNTLNSSCRPGCCGAGALTVAGSFGMNGCCETYRRCNRQDHHVLVGIGAVAR
jgi:hypothetical protein